MNITYRENQYTKRKRDTKLNCNLDLDTNSIYSKNDKNNIKNEINNYDKNNIKNNTNNYDKNNIKNNINNYDKNDIKDNSSIKSYKSKLNQSISKQIEIYQKYNKQEDEIDNDQQLIYKYFKFDEINKISNPDSIAELLKSHKDYIDHITGKCKCYTCQCIMMCKCNFKKFVIQIQNFYRTSYDSEFKDLKQDQIQAQLDEIIYNSQKTNQDNIKQQCESQSQQLSVTKKDYNFHKNYEYIKKKEKQDYQFSLPLKHFTHNQVNYIPKKAENLINFSTQQTPTVLKNTQFDGKTMYSEQFKPVSCLKENTQFFQCFQNWIRINNKMDYPKISNNQISYQQNQLPQSQRIYKYKESLFQQQSLKNLLQTESQRKYKKYDFNICP